MLKLVAFLAHQPPDIGNAKKLFVDTWQKSRQLLDSVVNGSSRAGGRRAWEFGSVKVEPCKQLVPVQLTKSRSAFATAWENVVTGYLSRNVRNGFASKIRKDGIFQGYVFGAGRSYGRYSGLAQKLVQYGFVGIGVAAGSNLYNYGDTEGADSIYGELRKMFANSERSPIDESFEDAEQAVVVKVEDIKLDNVIIGFWNSVILEAKVNLPSNGTVIDANRVNLENELIHHEAVCDQGSEYAHRVQNESSGLEDVTEMALEDPLGDTLRKICEQHQLLNGLRHTVHNQAVQIRRLLGESEFTEEFFSPGTFMDDYFGIALDEGRGEGFVFIKDATFDIQSTRPEDLDETEFATRSLLDSISASFDDLEEAVNLVEEQHWELVNIYKTVQKQNEILQHLVGQQNLQKQLECEVSGFQEVASGYQHAVDAKDDASCTLAVKVCPVMNCSADHANRMLIKELLPAMSRHLKVGKQPGWHLPVHFNVVEVYGGYLLPLSEIEPLNVHTLQCFQRPLASSINQLSAVCVVMKRYEFTLAEFLASHNPGIMESSLLLIQLLEAVVHLNANDVCHRNLNSDNIFVERAAGGCHLVISDFGQSLVGDGIFRLRVPFVTDEMLKGGCLLAPEIANAKVFSFLNYTKSDLWTVGAISYEIFGAVNPFYKSSSGDGLNGASYMERDLPDLPSSVPWYINSLVKLMLRKDPNNRPHPLCMANAFHILLWAPKEWISRLQSGEPMPTAADIRRWMVQLGATTFCSSNTIQCRRCDAYQLPVVTSLQSMFLARADLEMIFDAVRLLWLECPMVMSVSTS
jgi:serine/threonine protein kinase